ncbi:MAG TPA: IclR family transcriptional regulator [Jatrophihabitans sp.]
MPETSGVQSLDRAFELLERMADEGGAVGVSELAAQTGLPLPTIHRLIRSLMRGGYVRQDASRRYSLGPRLIRLGDMAGRMVGRWAMPRLSELVSEIGETANMAVLEGDAVVYVAQVPSAHSMRMFTEVGRRVLPHATGVGKALLSMLEDDVVLQLLGRTGMPAQTEHTITTPEALLAELRLIRKRGYAIDDSEQEIGVRCVAVPVADPQNLAAISVSGPSGRVTAKRVRDIAPVLIDAAAKLQKDLND